MEQLIFKSPEFGQVRSVIITGEPWLVGKDVAVALGYKDTSDALKVHVEEEDKGVGEIQTPGGIQKMYLINESGLYSLILGSKLPSAKKFKKWVTSEVLPSIRKTGTYQKSISPLKVMEQSLEVLKNHDDRLDKLENDAPVYMCEATEISEHVKRKGVNVLGGKQSPAYQDGSLRSAIYRDIYDQYKREFGLYTESGKKISYQWTQRKYIADAHEFIDSYTPPFILEEQILKLNACVYA